MTRKVIQIAMDSHPRAINPLHALCDDGSIWEHSWVNADGAALSSPQWVRIESPPQADPPRRIAGSFPEGEPR